MDVCEVETERDGRFAGVLLVGRGTEVTPGLIARIRNAADRVGAEIWVSGTDLGPRLCPLANANR